MWIYAFIHSYFYSRVGTIEHSSRYVKKRSARRTKQYALLYYCITFFCTLLVVLIRSLFFVRNWIRTYLFLHVGLYESFLWLTFSDRYVPPLRREHFCCAVVKLIGGGHRVPPAGLPIEQVLGEYSLSFLRRDVALLVSTRARDSFWDRRRVPPI